MRQHARIGIWIFRTFKHMSRDREAILLRFPARDSARHSPCKRPGAQASGHRAHRLHGRRVDRRIPVCGVVHHGAGSDKESSLYSMRSQGHSLADSVQRVHEDGSRGGPDLPRVRFAQGRRGRPEVRAKPRADLVQKLRGLQCDPVGEG